MKFLTVEPSSPEDLKLQEVPSQVLDGGTVPLVSNAITVSPTGQLHAVLTLGGVTSTRQLRTINGGTSGRIYVLRNSPLSTGDLIIDDEADNIVSAGNFTMNSPKDTITFVYDGVSFVELCRSNN